MCEDECRRSARRFERPLGKKEPVRQVGADRALSIEEPRPDALPRAVTESAVDVTDRRLDGTGDGLNEELPQATGGHLQAFDVISGPDAEGPPATRPCIAVAAKDPPRAEHDSSALIPPMQTPMQNEHANHLAMLTGLQFDLLGQRDPFLIVAVKPTRAEHVLISPQEIRESYRRKKCGGSEVRKRFEERGREETYCLFPAPSRYQIPSVRKIPVSDLNSTLFALKYDQSEVRDSPK